MKKTLILLRHGQSTYNLAHQFTGWADAPLTPLGRQQAAQAGTLLKEAHLLPQRAYCSCLQRAYQTLHEALTQTQCPVPFQADWRLNERHYGDFQNRTRQEAARLYGLSRVLACRQTFFKAPPPAADNRAAFQVLPHGLTPPNGESLQQVQKRALAFFTQAVFPAYACCDIQLVAAHEDLLRAMAVYFKKLPANAVENLVVPPAAPWIMELDDTYHAAKDYFLGDQTQIAAFLKHRPQ